MVTSEASRDNHEKFEALYEVNYKSIYTYVYRRVPHSPLDVPDVVSEVFATAWRRISDIPPAPQDRLWLFGVARNCLLGHHRRWSRRLQLLSHLGAQPNRVELVETGVDPLHLRVRAALQELRPLDREVILLVYWDGLSHSEAATVLGCSVNAVALRIKKAKGRLETYLGFSSPSADSSFGNPSTPMSTKEQSP